MNAEIVSGLLLAGGLAGGVLVALATGRRKDAEEHQGADADSGPLEWYPTPTAADELGTYELPAELAEALLYAQLHDLMPVDLSWAPASWDVTWQRSVSSTGELPVLAVAR